jgi:divalent metal cation (Fe/Co/Zn/Cd) transporter
VTAQDRAALVRRGLRLNYVTVLYNSFEAIASLIAGFLASSVALVGFGLDSTIELTASVAAQWRLRADHDHEIRERVERVTRRIIGATFLALAVYVTYDSVRALWLRERPERSWLGIAILVMSAVVMPVLARAKRRVALAIGSRALEADAQQTSLCAYLSVIALAGVAVNAFAGWWWGDPIAALAMVPIIAKEGVEDLRDDSECERC